MNDIAKALGISISTVSRALANSPKVKPETREFILNKARDLNYTPDPSLSSLIAYRRRRITHVGYHGTLAFLTCYPKEDGWRSLWSSVRLFEALQKLAPAHGYQVKPFWLHSKRMPAKRLNQILLSRNIRGIFLPSLPQGVDTVDFLWENYAVVSLSETVQSPRVSSVQTGVYYNIRMALKKLVEYGYSAPTMIAHERFHQGIHGLHTGAFYSATQEFLGCERPVYHADREAVPRRVKKWIRESKADCLLTSFDSDALSKAVATVCPAVSFSMPLARPHFSGLVTTHEVIAETALDYLVQQLNLGKFGLPENPVVLRIAGQWHPGDLSPKGEGSKA